MKVIVNCRFLTQPMTGVQQYGLKLATYLKDRYTGEIEFVSPKGIIHNRIAEKLGVTIIGNTRGFFWEQVELPFWLKKEGSPLLLNFGNVAPQYYTNQLVTIHDLSTLEHPEWFSNKFARAYKFVLPQVVHHAKKVIAVSFFTKARIMEVLKVEEKKIEVIYNSVEEMSLPPVHKKTAPYFLSVGSFSGRKNFAALIRAFKQADLPGVQLKIRGDTEDIFKEDPELDSMVKNDDRIFFIEPLDYQAYLGLLQNALALINTSLYEGFGMPNLEALSLGTPVICSDIEVFEEICGPCATYVDPLDQDKLCELMKNAASNMISADDREKLVERSTLFRTEKEGKKLVDLISKCMNS